MKKIIATMLTLVLLALLCAVPAGAETAEPELDRDQLEKLFLAYCRQTQYEGIPQGDSVTIDEIVEIDGVYLFTGRYSEDKKSNQPYSATAGDYRLYCYTHYRRFDLYAYYYNDKNPNAINKDGWEITMVPFGLREWFGNVLATNKDIINFEGITIVEQLYKSEIITHLYEQYKGKDESLAAGHNYEEIFYYYDNNANTDESKPEYVLFRAIVEVDEWGRDPLPPSYVLGNYGVYPGDLQSTAPYYYGIYLPKEDRVYTVEEAYNAGINGIEAIFEEDFFPCGIIGDADGDKKITVKDATCIQKYSVEIEFETLNYNLQLYLDRNDLRNVVFDFNRDDAVNVKDATAIQKHIAGLEV